MALVAPYMLAITAAAAAAGSWSVLSIVSKKFGLLPAEAPSVELPAPVVVISRFVCLCSSCALQRGWQSMQQAVIA